MSLLFISNGGNPTYNNQLTYCLYQNNLHLSPAITFFTLHPLPDPTPLNYYYLPAQKDSGLSAPIWSITFEEKITQLIQQSQTQTIILLGSYAYTPLLKVMKSYPSLDYIWLKPPGSPLVSHTKREKYFDQVIVLSSITELQEIIVSKSYTF